MVRIASVQFASEDNSDGMPKAIRQIEFGSCQTGQGQARALFGEEVECVIAEDMRGTPSCQQADEADWKLLLDGVQMRQQRAAIDLMNIHGGYLTRFYTTPGRRPFKIGLNRNSI
jgi:hypothetical protein